MFSFVLLNDVDMVVEMCDIGESGSKVVVTREDQTSLTFLLPLSFAIWSIAVSARLDSALLV